MSAEYLLEGEEIFDPKKKDEEEKVVREVSDDEINIKYRKGEMRIVTEQGRINLDSIVNLLESEKNGKSKYILNPEYQRRKRWSNRQKSLLIESFIINVPIPPIFLYEVEYAVYEVMDGLQRLTAIYDFYKDKFVLTGLEYWKELEGKTYSNLPENVRAGIDRRYLSSIILLEETAKSKKDAESLKQIVFERLNSGGEKLMPQETRNALYNGNFNKICIKLAENELYRKMWNFPLEEEVDELLLLSEDDLLSKGYKPTVINSYRRMDDVELVLRFFAYRHIEHWFSPVDKFLDEFLKKSNINYDKEVIKKLENVFVDTVELIYTLLGERAFYLPDREGVQKHNSPTKTIYDSLMQSVAKVIDKKEILLKHAETIRAELYSGDLNRLNKEKNPYLFDARYSNKNDVADRINYFDNFFERILEL